MARTQRADELRSLSPAEYFKKYCVDEEIGQSLRVLKNSCQRDEAESYTENEGNAVAYSVVNITHKRGSLLHLKEEFQRHASENQWSTRRERGLPWQLSSFDFISEVYVRWIGEGLTRADLKKVDEPLWKKLCNDIKARRREGLTELPEGLVLPTQAEAVALALPEEQRAALDVLRTYHRERKAEQRAASPKPAA